MENSECLIRENGDFTDVYLSGDDPTIQNPAVAFELANHLSALRGVDSRSQSLVLYLLQAPLEKLPGILENYNIFLPSEASGEASGHVDDISEQIRRLEIAATSVSLPGLENEPPYSLEELIPTLNSRVQNITRLAEQFSLSDSSTPRANATQPNGLGAPRGTGSTSRFHQARTTSPTTSSSLTARGGAASSARFTVTGRGGLPGLSAQSARPTRSCQPTAQETSIRHIGFLGEVFVSITHLCNSATHFF